MCLRTFFQWIFIIGFMGIYTPVFSSVGPLFMNNNPGFSCALVYLDEDDNIMGLCSGEIVGRNWFLTAGHCKDTTYTSVVFCPHSSYREFYPVAQIITHPNYREDGTPYDQALVRVRYGLPYHPVSLPKNASEVNSLLEKECAVFGYGLDSSGELGTLVGISAEFNDAIFVENMVGLDSSAKPRVGGSGAGLLCREKGQNKWIRVGTISQTEIGFNAALFSSSLNWIVEIVSGVVAYAEISEVDPLVEKILSGTDDLPTQVAGLSINKSIKVPEWQWVDIVKPIMNQFRGISITNQYSNASAMLEKGESCGIKYGGSVEILGFSPEGEKALLEYSSPGDDLGTPCPSEAVFFLSTEELASFEERYAERVHREEQRDALVEKILSGANDLPTQVADLSVNEATHIPEWQWINVVKPIENQYSNGFSMLEKGENCGIQGGGSIAILGFSPEGEKALVVYSSPGDDAGTPCPEGALFFMFTEELASFEGQWWKVGAIEKPSLVDKIVDLLKYRISL